MEHKKKNVLIKFITLMMGYFSLYLDDFLLIAAGICLVIAAYEKFGRPEGTAVAGLCLASYAIIIARSRGGGRK